MFNNKFLKNDPLLEAVKAARADGDARRLAESMANDLFGVYSRKAVIREHLSDYDYALEEAYKCLSMKEEDKMATRDWDGDKRIETEKKEIWGRRLRKAKEAGKYHGPVDEKKMWEGSPLDPKDPSVQVSGDVTEKPPVAKKAPNDPSVQGSGDVTNNFSWKTRSGHPAPMNEEKKKWIQAAIKKKGALSKQLGVPEEKNIPAKKLSAAAKEGGKLGQRARLAQTLKKLHKEENSFNSAQVTESNKLGLGKTVNEQSMFDKSGEDWVAGHTKGGKFDWESASADLKKMRSHNADLASKATDMQKQLGDMQKKHGDLNKQLNDIKASRATPTSSSAPPVEAPNAPAPAPKPAASAPKSPGFMDTVKQKAGQFKAKVDSLRAGKAGAKPAMDMSKLSQPKPAFDLGKTVPDAAMKIRGGDTSSLSTRIAQSIKNVTPKIAPISRFVGPAASVAAAAPIVTNMAQHMAKDVANIASGGKEKSQMGQSYQQGHSSFTGHETTPGVKASDSFARMRQMSQPKQATPTATPTPAPAPAPKPAPAKQSFSQAYQAARQAAIAAKQDPNKAQFKWTNKSGKEGTYQAAPTKKDYVAPSKQFKTNVGATETKTTPETQTPAPVAQTPGPTNTTAKVHTVPAAERFKSLGALGDTSGSIADMRTKPFAKGIDTSAAVSANMNPAPSSPAPAPMSSTPAPKPVDPGAIENQKRKTGTMNESVQIGSNKYRIV